MDTFTDFPTILDSMPAPYRDRAINAWTLRCDIHARAARLKDELGWAGATVLVEKHLMEHPTARMLVDAGWITDGTSGVCTTADERAERAGQRGAMGLAVLWRLVSLLSGGVGEDPLGSPIGELLTLEQEMPDVTITRKMRREAHALGHVHEAEVLGEWDALDGGAA